MYLSVVRKIQEYTITIIFEWKIRCDFIEIMELVAKITGCLFSNTFYNA